MKFVPLGLASLATLVCVEGLASIFVGVRDAPPPPQDRFASERKNCRYDAELGWCLRPNLRIARYFRDGATFTTNGQGHRGRVETTVDVPEGEYRIVCIGDSFTMGYGVSDEETFPHRLHELDGVQCINQGVSGFGLDQIFLGYVRDGSKFDADLVLCCVIEDDLSRMLFQRFAGRYPKPHLEVVDDELLVRNVPVPEEAAPSARGQRLIAILHELGLARLVRRPNKARKKAIVEGTVDLKRVSEAVLRGLAEECRASKREFVVVLLPTRRDLVKHRSEASLLLGRLSKKVGVEFVDLTPELRRVSPKERNRLFRVKEGDGHYTPEGNRRIAGLLFERLSLLVPGFPER